MRTEVLHKIVRSMTTNEKRNFKRQFVGRDGTKYLQLYQLLNREDLPATHLLLKELNCNEGSLRSVAEHLFELLMQYMDKVEDSDALKFMRWAKMLAAKGIKDLAQSMLERARLAALEQDEQELLLHVLGEELKLAEEPLLRGQLLDIYNKASSELQTYLQLRDCRVRLFDAVKARNADNQLLVRSIKTASVLSDGREMDWRSKAEFLKCRRIIQTFERSFLEAMQTSKMLAAHLTERRSVLSWANEWIDEQGALIQLCILNGEPEQGRKALFELGAFESGHPSVGGRIWQVATSTRLAWAADEHDLETGRAILGSLAESLKGNADYLDAKTLPMLHFNAIKVCFLCEDHVAVLRWTRRLEDLPGVANARTPVLLWAKVYQVMAMVQRPELGWGLDTVVANIRRLDKLSGGTFELPGLVAKIGAHVSRYGPPDRKALREWLKVADELIKDKHQAQAFSKYANSGAWLEAWIENVPLLQTKRMLHAAQPSQAKEQDNASESA